MVIKQAFQYKTKGICTLKRGLNKRIRSSPSEMNMRNSVLQVLLTRKRLIEECII